MREDIKLTCVYSRGSDVIAKYISTHVKIIKDKFLLPKIIVSRGGWFGSSIVFQGDTIVMLLKCFLLVGERKFYPHVTPKVHNTRVTMKDYTY